MRRSNYYPMLRSIPINTLFSLVEPDGRPVDSVYLYRGTDDKGAIKVINTRIKKLISWDEQALNDIRYVYEYGVRPIVVKPVDNIDFYYRDSCVARVFNHQLHIARETPKLVENHGYVMSSGHPAPEYSFLLKGENLAIRLGPVIDYLWSRNCHINSKWLEVEPEFYY